MRHHPRQTSTVPEPSEPPERPAPKAPSRAGPAVASRARARAPRRGCRAARTARSVGAARWPIPGCRWRASTRPRLARGSRSRRRCPRRSRARRSWSTCGSSSACRRGGSARRSADRCPPRTAWWRRTTSGPGRPRCPARSRHRCTARRPCTRTWTRPRSPAACDAVLESRDAGARARQGRRDRALRPAAVHRGARRRGRRGTGHAAHDPPARPGAGDRATGRGARRARRSDGRVGAEGHARSFASGWCSLRLPRRLRPPRATGGRGAAVSP